MNEFTGESPMFRTGNNYDTELVSLKTGLACPPDENKTQQQFKDDADINEIVRRFGITGVLPENFRAPQYGDFSDVMDYQSALNAVIAADDAFMHIPPDIRDRFNNNPQRLLDFLADENNRYEAVKLGLIPRPAETARDGTAVPSDRAPSA